MNVFTVVYYEMKVAWRMRDSLDHSASKVKSLASRVKGRMGNIRGVETSEPEVEFCRRRL